MNNHSQPVYHNSDPEIGRLVPDAQPTRVLGLLLLSINIWLESMQ